MSIASRIEQIEQHITDDYSVLELAGADLTNVDKNILNLKQSWEERLLYFLANGTDVIWNNWLPKVTGSGETITLNNTIEAKMDFVYKGNTYQYSTTGKNLLRYDAGTYTSGNITNATYGNIAVIDINNSISLVEGETYYISADIKLNSGTCQILNTLRVLNSNSGRTENNTATIQQPTISNNYQRYIFSFVAKENVNGTKFYAQGYNMSNASFTITNIMLSTTNTNYEPYTNGPAPNPSYPYLVNVVTGNNSITISNNDNTQSQTCPVNLGSIELCKIGDYQDKIYKDNGKWYLNKQIGKVVLDGSENWGNFSIEPSGLGRAIVSSSNVYYNSTQNTIMANNMVGVSYGGSWNHTYDCISSYSYNSFIAYLKNASDLATFKSILNNSNAIVYYVLATPTYEEITDTTLISQLEAIKKSYNTQTSISQVNNDLPFELDVVALGELT